VGVEEPGDLHGHRLPSTRQARDGLEREAAAASQFYLARVPSAAAGHTLVLSLYDIGDGSGVTTPYLKNFKVNLSMPVLYGFTLGVVYQNLDENGFSRTFNYGRVTQRYPDGTAAFHDATGKVLARSRGTFIVIDPEHDQLHLRLRGVAHRCLQHWLG
jgi:hypothetical protein